MIVLAEITGVLYSPNFGGYPCVLLSRNYLAAVILLIISSQLKKRLPEFHYTPSFSLSYYWSSFVRLIKVGQLWDFASASPSLSQLLTLL